MTRKAPTVCRAATIDADNNVKNKAFINLGFIPIVLEWFSSKNETIRSFHLMHNIKREQKPIIPTWIISSKEIARILGQNFANDDLINEFVSFCASQNSYFQKQTFLNAIEDNKKIVEEAEAKWNISNRVKNLDFLNN